MAKIDVVIEVEETGANKWTATYPPRGLVETRPTKWQAVQAIVNKLASDEATTNAVKMHGQGS